VDVCVLVKDGVTELVREGVSVNVGVNVCVDVDVGVLVKDGVTELVREGVSDGVNLLVDV
jgi:hypothetical protein